MRKFLVLLLFPLTLQAQNAKEIASKCMSSTVSIIMKDKHMKPVSLGSGFIISDGKVVTNLHVIEEARYGTVIISGQKNEHKIQGWLNVDKVNDLAILSVPTIGSNSLQLSSGSEPSIGEKIYAIGNPQGLSGTISEGIVSAIRNTEGKSLIQITAPISPGSSGGPVIDNNGNLIGVAVSTLASGQNLNFAIPSSKVIALSKKAVTAINKLNFSKNVTSKKTSSDEVDISDGVDIKINGSSRFIIRNKTPYLLTNIKILIIALDKEGFPLDYVNCTLFEENKSFRDYRKKWNAVKNYENDKKDWEENIKKSKLLDPNDQSTWVHMPDYYHYWPNQPNVRKTIYQSQVIEYIELCKRWENSGYDVVKYSYSDLVTRANEQFQYICKQNYILLPFLGKTFTLTTRPPIPYNLRDFLSTNYSTNSEVYKFIYRVLDFNIYEE